MYFVTDNQLFFNALNMATILAFIYFISLLWAKFYLQTIIVGKSDIGIASWIKTPDGIIRFVNDTAMHQIFHPVGCYNPVGMTFSEIFNDEIATMVRILDAKAVQSHTSAKMSVIPFPDEIGPMYVLKVITEQKDGQEILRGFALPFETIVDLPTMG